MWCLGNWKDRKLAFPQILLMHYQLWKAKSFISQRNLSPGTLKKKKVPRANVRNRGKAENTGQPHYPPIDSQSLVPHRPWSKRGLQDPHSWLEEFRIQDELPRHSISTFIWLSTNIALANTFLAKQTLYRTLPLLTRIPNLLSSPTPQK